MSKSVRVPYHDFLILSDLSESNRCIFRILLQHPFPKSSKESIPLKKE